MQNAGTILTIVLVVVLVVLLLGGFGMGPGMMRGFGGYGGMMGGYGNQFGYAFNPIGAIIALASWALIIGGAGLLVVRLARNGTRISTSSGSPLDLLKARYAKGEVTKEQFDALKHDLIPLPVQPGATVPSRNGQTAGARDPKPT